MATLSELLTSAAEVRNETASEQNTALRVGNVLYFLTRYLQQYTSVVDITMKVSGVGVTITAKSLSGDTTLFDKTIALPVASNSQAGILTAEAYAAIKSDIKELQEAFAALPIDTEELSQRISANTARISDLSLSLAVTEKKADTATRLLYFDAVVSNPTIEEMQGINDYNSIVFDTSRGLFLAEKDGKYYNAFPGADHYNKNFKARTDRLFIQTATQLVYIVEGTSLRPFILSESDKTKMGNYPMTPLEIPLATLQKPGLMAAADCRNLSQASSTASANKAKLDKYPAQFVMDFGLVESQAAGEQMAAASEVAGNRNISFIRFQVNGVRAKKTTLILQWPNGIDETAQIKFTDKTEWRRNVTGATGVEGAATAATQWERTAPHYIGYDTARRMVQLKDYTQTVSREVELPLATSSQPGLMSAADKTKLGNYPTSPNVFTPATAFQALVSKTEQNEQRIGAIESVHAPSDYVEMTIKNDKAQRNVLFFKIEYIDDLEIDGRPINTEGLDGKYYRSLSVGEHKVRFHVSDENRTKRGLLGWADDEEAGYISNVTRIVIPEGWTELPANCFERRKHLEEVVLPSTLAIVGDNCFQSLSALRELIIPKNVTTINWSAINDCASLKSIRMGGSESMPLSLAHESIRNCPALTCIEFLPCQLTFTGSTSPFQNLPQLNALICHLTAAPTFEPSTPFGTIGSGTTERKTLYRPAGVSFYDEGAWLNNLRNGLGFYVADL